MTPRTWRRRTTARTWTLASKALFRGRRPRPVPLGNLARAVAQVDTLCKVFRLKRPHVSFVPTQWAAGTAWGRAEITLSPRATEDVVVHEVAHVLADTRAGKPVRHHGDKRFIQALNDVIEAWYGDPELYDWSDEYKVVQRAKEKDSE